MLEAESFLSSKHTVNPTLLLCAGRIKSGERLSQLPKALIATCAVFDKKSFQRFATSRRKKDHALMNAIENGVATPTSPRLADERLHRFLIFAGVELGLPVQFHVGYGDRDLDLHRCNPLLLTGLLRTIEPTGVPVMLLHNYPYHREAGYLAQVFGNVYVDIGLAMHNVGRRASVLLAEALELTPFGKFLHSSDAFGLPELHYLGAVLFRRALSDMLADGLTDGAWTEDDAVRFAELIGAGNARRVYGLPSRSDIRPVQPPRIRPGSAPSASESSEA